METHCKGAGNCSVKIPAFLLALFFSLGALAGNPQDALSNLLSSSSLSRENVGLIVFDLKKDRNVVAHGETTSLIPASIMKAVTTASLKNHVRADKQLATQVFLTGDISDGTLDGNILVMASGDPSVNSSSGPDSADILTEIVEALKEKGVKRIKGKVIVDESVFAGPAVPPSWQKGDLPHAYGTGCHGFNFESNSSAKKAVSNPVAVFNTKLQKALGAAGISLAGGSVDDKCKDLLVEHLSAPLEDVMRSCMLRSDNLYAESFLRLFAVETGREGSTLMGASGVKKFWTDRKCPMEGVEIIDGSGLSRSNRMTASFLTDVLKKMKHDEIYVSFFPLVGEEGTVKNFMKDTRLAGYLALKTGSMSGIQCYAGYKLDEDYAPTHVIVVMVNKLKNRAKFREDLSTFFLDIFD